MIAWNRTVGDIVSEIKMMQTSFKGFFWLVEGPSDIRFFTSRKFANVELIVGGGKLNVVNSVKALSRENDGFKVLGIVDADYDWLIRSEHRPNNIITTDPRDLEGVLIRSSAFDKVLSEYADEAKVKEFEQKNKCTVREYLHDLSVFFGRIRAFNDIARKVDLKKLKPQRFMEKGKWSYDFDDVLSVSVSLGVSASVEELIKGMYALPEVESWNYVRGHDAVDIFAGGLLTELGRGVKLDAFMIESVLRVGIQDHEYYDTKLYKSISGWHEANEI
ncbi:DUF4435 domain-containing protein [Pseudomonas syringae group sp. 247E2]|uniref:DUF4435 domain-containing protein n=1 Tax=Pseudomonas syringae group sp. 247E2 TaxID=3079592 RepID=UPI00290DA545|nr:DUF4435 domain-containing protein [Pseudomonas syringae group sp. 247E2]MDU8604687.1 DUF4435 domain-containing protein [Pseudomonas syringae group sp. 247E2]